MTLEGLYDTLAGLSPSEKDYCQLMSDEMMLACKLISAGQTLALRRTWANYPVAREMAPIPEEEAEGEVEDEVPLVRQKRALEVS